MCVTVCLSQCAYTQTHSVDMWVVWGMGGAAPSLVLSCPSPSSPGRPSSPRTVRRTQRPATLQETQVRGCTGGASHQDDREEESSVGGPWWATGGWLRTGSHLTGPRSPGTGRSPGGGGTTMWIQKIQISQRFLIKSSQTCRS